MKKLLTAFLLTCSCALMGAAVACGGEEVEESSAASRSVTFSTGTGYTFYSSAPADGKVAEGSLLTFEVELGAFYAGNLTVYVNDTIVNPDADGVYSYTVGGEDLSIRLEGVRKDISNMTGSGTLEDAYVVSKPIDLLYIAEHVNKGDRHFATASYVLANDIDCKGEELDVIGDYSTESSVFSGSFASGVNEETGERERYTISNFTINAENKNYVGLFGTIFADMSVQSSGLIYGIRLEDFTINAGVNGIQDENKSVSCGSLVGYAVGANFYLCDAVNGEINVVADSNYFSFVGGLVGYQQGFYNESYGVYNPSEISYSNVDVDVNILGGVALYAGGITGYATTNYPYGATAAIHNSYANGSITGALRSGGIIGGLGRYSVVSNCYATGEITARSYQPADSLLITTTEYCHAYAGGIVGYAENDTIAHDSFFNGSVYAFTASDKFSSDYAHSHNEIGGGDEARTASVEGEKYVSLNNLAHVDASTDAAFTDTLGWSNYNWTFVDGKLPVINYASTEATITLSLTLKYVAPDGTPITVQGKTEVTQNYFDTSIQSLNSYNPIGSFMDSGSLLPYYQADNATSDVVMRSYGYFFDEGCTQKVPVGYMPMKNITLYIGFANIMPAVGEYTFSASAHANKLHLELKSDGTAIYDDGSTKLTTSYGFDGKRVVLDNARLTRYYDGEIVIDEQDTTSFQDENFDLNRYNFYSFAGVFVNDELHLFDGTYFTAEKPLIATKKTGGTDAPSQFDIFKGTWTTATTLNKTYTFDGKGNWSYKQVANEWNGSTFTQVEKATASGTYTVSGNELTIYDQNKTKTHTAQFNSDGFLQITDNNQVSQLYFGEHSFEGRWKGTDFDLVLSGIRNDGYGYASLISVEGFTTELLYEVSETSGVIAFYYPATDDKYKTVTKDYLYGYATFDASQNVLSFVYPDTEGTAGYLRSSLYLYDTYYGEWVCEHEDFKGVSLNFNGLGLYSSQGANLSGVLTLIDGDKVTEIPYQLNSSLSGKFAYGNKTYQITFNEATGNVNVEIIGFATTELERKDEFAGLTLVDITGKEFCEIDGRSTLNEGGVLSFKGVDYRYFPAANGYEVKKEGETVGNIVKQDTHYLLTIGNEQTALYTANKFMGDWAISGQYNLFAIGPTDLNGVIQATFKGVPVQLTFLDPATLTFEYKEDKMPYTYYVFIIADELTGQDVLVISEFTNFMLGDYFICSKVNDLFGTWKWNQDNGQTTMRFDGISSGYVNGYAELTLNLNHSQIVTPYYYTIRDTGIVFWSRDVMAERTWYFRLDVVGNEHANDSDAFVLYDEAGNVKKVMKRAAVDGLYLTEAYGKDGQKYLFDGNGNMKLFDGDTLTDTVKYTYTIKSYNSDQTATLEVVDRETGIKYSATLNYSDSTYIEFILGNPITE